MTKKRTSSKVKTEAVKPPVNVAIAGPMDSVCHRLVHALDQDPAYSHIILLGLSKPSFSFKKVKSIPLELKQPFEEDMRRILHENNVEALVIRPLSEERFYKESFKRYMENTIAPAVIFKASLSIGISKIVIITSTQVYGALPLNHCFLTEDTFPAAPQEYPYLRHIVELDLIASSFLLDKHKENTKLILLRPAPLIGPKCKSTFKELLFSKFSPSILGYDPPIQLLHEDDLISGIVLALKNDISGIFNLVAEGFVSWNEALKIAGSKKIPIIPQILYPVAKILWKFNLSPLPPSELAFIHYPLVADGSRAKQLGFRPKYTTVEAIKETAKEICKSEKGNL